MKMLTKNKDGMKTGMEYAAVLLGFILMYLFMVPQMDVLLLSHYVEDNIGAAIDFSLYYGNGRLLGNIFGIHFSNHFVYASFVVAFFLTAIVVLLNCILFDNDPNAVFPLAIFVAVPSTAFVQKCYYTFASFTNFVMPIPFFLFGVWVFTKLAIKKETYTRKNPSFLLLSGFISIISACLFSENTTILIVVASIAMVFYCYLSKKKTSVYLWLQMAAAVIGGVVMYLVPIVTGTSENLSSYRQISSGLAEILKNGVYSYFKFADILNHLHMLLFLFCGAMVLVCVKQTRWKESLKPVQIGIFAAYPLICLLFNQFDSNGALSYTTILKLADAFLVGILALDVVITVLRIDDRKLRLCSILMAIVTVCTVAPMMIVNANGNRTYYTTFICMTAFAVMLLRAYCPASLKKLIASDTFRKAATFISTSGFALITAMLLLTSLYNYDFYVLRCNDMVEAASAGETIQAPTMPFVASSLETHDEQTMFLALNEKITVDTKVIALSEWEHFETYRDEIVKNPVNALRFAFENWEFKDAQYPSSLLP